MPQLAEADVAWNDARAKPVLNPADRRDVVGYVMEANEAEVAQAVAGAVHAAPIWAATPVADRARCLTRAAQILEDEMQRADERRLGQECVSQCRTMWLA